MLQPFEKVTKTCILASLIVGNIIKTGTVYMSGQVNSVQLNILDSLVSRKFPGVSSSAFQAKLSIQLTKFSQCDMLHELSLKCWNNFLFLFYYISPFPLFISVRKYLHSLFISVYFVRWLVSAWNLFDQWFMCTSNVHGYWELLQSKPSRCYSQ